MLYFATQLAAWGYSMYRIVCLVIGASLALANAALAENSASRDAQPEHRSRIVKQTMTPVLPAAAAAKPVVKKRTAYSLSSALTKGADNQDLSMEERWANNVVICERIQVTGSRHRSEVCRTRGEWQALRTDARDAMVFSR